MLSLFKRKASDLKTADGLNAGTPKGRVFLIVDCRIGINNNFHIALRCAYAFARGCLDKGYRVGAVANDMFFDLTSNRKEVNKIASVSKYTHSSTGEFAMMVAATRLFKPAISINPLASLGIDTAHLITSQHFNDNCVNKEAMKELLYYKWRLCSPTPFKPGEAKNILKKQRGKCFIERPNDNSQDYIVLVSDFIYMEGAVSVCGYCLKEQGVNLLALRLPLSQGKPPEPFVMIGDQGAELGNSYHASGSISSALALLP